MQRIRMTSHAICMLLSGLLFSASVFAGELAGTWTLTIDTPRGVQHPTLVIADNDGSYSGVYNSLRGPIEVPEITRDGDNFSFPLAITVPIGKIEVDYAGKISDENMIGKVKSPRGEVPFTAKRSAP